MSLEGGTNTTQRRGEIARPFYRVWNWLAAPPPEVEGIENRYRARLLSSLLIFLIPQVVLSILIRAFVSPASRLPLVAAISVIVMAVAYSSSRTKYYRIGAALTVTSFPLLIFIVITTANFNLANSTSLLAFLVLNVLLASMLFGVRGTALVAAASMGIVLVVPALSPDVGVSSLLSLLTLLVLSSTVLGVSVLSRDALENTRRAALLDSEAHHHSLFEESPISLWEEDLSSVKKRIDDLPASGVSDFKTYFEENPALVADCANRVRIADANQATLALFRARAKDDLIAEPNMGIGAHSTDFFLKKLTALAEGRTKFETETTIQTLQGDTLHVIASLTVAPGYEDTWEKVFISLLDITERYLTNAALARERDILKALGQAAQAIQRAHEPEEIYQHIGNAIRQLNYHAAVLRISADQQHLEIAYRTASAELSAQIQQLVGVQRSSIRIALRPDSLHEQILQMKSAVFLEDTGALVANSVPSASPSNVSQISELVGKRAIASPLITGATILGLLVVTGPDLTERDVPAVATFSTQAAIALENLRLYQELARYAEGLEAAVEERTADLQHTKDRAEAILNSVGEALLVIAPDGRIQQVNPAFEQQTGYTSQEVLHRVHHHFLLTESMPSDVFQESTQAMRAGEDWLGEMPVRRKDGTVYDAAVTITPLRDSAGEAIAFVGALRDISAQKEIRRMKDAFVSNASHELRTPIASMKLNTSLLRMNPENQEAYIDRLERETGRLADLIEDLLRLSRLDQGRIKLDLRAVDLNALAARYVEDRVPLAETRELDLRLGDHPGLPAIQADEGLLGQALSVLITNALHYTPAGGEVVISTLVRQEDEGQWVGISVSDNGPGISPEDKAHLFERFYRGKVGRNSAQPGTGLGLAIAQEIVERHAGRIEVESTGVAGQGTTFSIWLPVSRVEVGRVAG